MGEQGPAPPRACGDGVEHVPRFGLRRSVWWSGKAALSPRGASRGTQHPLSQGGVMSRAAWSTNLSCARDVCRAALPAAGALPSLRLPPYSRHRLPHSCRTGVR